MIKFGDIPVKQLLGITMSMNPAPSLANLYIEIHKQAKFLKFLSNTIFYMRRFINEGLEILTHHQDPATDAAD